MCKGKSDVEKWGEEVTAFTALLLLYLILSHLIVSYHITLPCLTLPYPKTPSTVYLHRCHVVLRKKLCVSSLPPLGQTED